MSEKRYCKVCGSELPEGAKFCGKCGAPVSEDDAVKKLAYRTRGESTAQNKERVYFTCYPDDFELYFDSICKDILATQNCAIFYKKDSSYEWTDAEMEEALGQMQLFVIPVTSRFLYQGNPAREKEFRFALGHQIPVLPLMEEEGLDQEFNRICGDLQFLDKAASEKDSTAIPYDEKLKDFLSSVLLGDELSAQVREAFDAYIFMSYRKKDRKYAQELMRLIHSNEFCRDIAIWYDEYLIPGENFNQAIRDAMEKSDLFTLVVTPSLLEPDNYVMKNEYPMAKEEKKPILPAEMVKTDEDQLKEDYSDIPEPTDAKNTGDFADALLEQVKNLDIEENNDDPEHQYLIGLAYLSGIDVEMDSERAVRLITAAADADLPEAMQKLSDMYKNGEGVERDYETSVQWLEKLAKYWEKKFNESESEEDGWNYFHTLWYLGDAWYEMRQLNPAKEAYQKMLSTAEYLSLHFDSKKYRRDLPVSYNKLGDISREQGHLDESKELYLKGLKLSEELSRETGTLQSRRDLSLSYENLGDITRMEGRFDEARDWYLKGLGLDEELNRETGTLRERHGLLASYYKLGNISLMERKLDEAKEWYLKGLELGESLTRETGTVEARRDLAVSYEKMGDIAWTEGHLDEAKEWYQKELKLNEELCQETGTVEARRDLSVSYDKLGNISREEGHPDEAKEWYLKGQKLHEELTQETGTVEARRDLMATYNNLGDIDQAEGHLEEAKEWYLKGLKLDERLNQETGMIEVCRDLMVSYGNLGDISQAEGHLDEAKEWYLKGLKLSEEISRETGTVEARRNLSVSYEKMGNISQEGGYLDEAKEWYLKSQKLCEELNQETGTVEARRDLSVSYEKLGDITQAEGHLDEAKGWYQKGLKLREELNKETGTVEARRNLTVNYVKLGNISRAEGNLEEEKELYLKGLRLSEELCRETGTPQAYDDLAILYIKIGSLDGHHYNISMFENAESIYRMLAECYPQVTRYADNLQVIQKILKK